MHEGISIQPWNQPQVTPLVISILVLVGLWILQVGFPREARRMVWAWSKPRSIASRNASETPRTFGVALSHALAYFGMVAGILTVFKTSEWTPPWWVPALWLASLAVLKWLGSKLAFGATDLASSSCEVSRHNQTWMGAVLAVWALAAALNPWIRHSDMAVWGALTAFALTSLYGNLQASRLIQGHNSHRVVGILYLCTLEWGWSLFWILWSIRAALRGH